ncbi:hypothetical protein PPTG_19819, partial [Phytophthora nicotianae INRA-310]
MPKSRGYKNYSKDEISLLLAILEELLPVCTAEWINAVELYASRKERSWGDRTMASLRRKFVGLWSVSYPSSSFPALRAQARRIKGQIDNLQSSRIARSRSIPSRKLQSISSAPEQENHEQVRPDRRRLPGRSASFRVNVPEMLQDGPSFFGYSTALVGSNHGNDVVVDKATVRTPRDPGVGSIRYDPSFPSHPSPTVPNVPSLMPFVSKPRPDIRVTRTAIMKLYNQMIQLVVKAQVDAERREVERGDRERLERISALQYKNQLMAMITALHRPMQS